MALAPVNSSLRKRCFSFVLAMSGAVFPSLLYPAHGQETAAIQGVEAPRDIQSGATAPEKTTLRGKPSVLTAIQALPGSVELTFSAPVEFRRAMLRGNAERAGRFYVDAFPASLVSQRGSTLEIATGPVRRVRSSLFRAGVVRVVLDLREEGHFHVTTLTDPYRLVITAQPQTSATNQAQPVAHPTDMRQDSISSAKSVSEKIKQSPLFPNVEWQVMNHPWPFMLPSRPPAVDTALSSSSSVAVVDATRQTDVEGTELGFLRQVDEFTRQFSILSPEFAPPPNQPLSLSPWQPTAEAELSPPKEFAPGWEWEVACRDGGCIRLTVREGEEVDINPAHERQREIQTVNQEAGQQIVSVSAQPKHEAIRPGGAVMGELWLAAMTAGVCLSFLAGISVVMLWNLRKRGTATGKSDSWEGRMAYLEEAVNRAGLLNNSFFHSLEVSQKRLAALLTQADVSEQNLRRLLHQAAFTGERATTGRSLDALATAAVLLAEGEAVPQVARLLKLPVAQVRLLQEIRQSTQGEKPAETPEKPTGHSPLGSEVSSLESLRAHLNGATRNGMPLAQSEQSL